MSVTVKSQAFIFKKIKAELLSGAFIEELGYLSNNPIKLYNCLVDMILRWGYVCISQEKLASYFGKCREWANRVIQLFKRMGLIYIETRPYRSCIFRIPALLKDQEVVRFLANWFAPFRGLIKKKVTPINLVSYKLEKLSPKVDILMGESTFEGDKSLYFRRGDDPGGPGITKISQKGEKGYEMTGNQPDTSQRSPVSTVILSLAELNLTKWGQIKLSAYPQGALLYAKKNMKLALMATNPFAYVLAICSDWCANSGIRPDFEKSNKLACKYGMPQDAPMVMRKIVNLPESLPFSVESGTLFESSALQQQNKKAKCMNDDQGVPGITAARTWELPPRPVLSEEEKSTEVRKVADTWDTPGVKWMRGAFGDEMVQKIMANIINNTLRR